MHYDHLIIGGGVAGHMAAETIRSRDAQASILVIGSEPYALYSRVILPHVVRGDKPEATAFLKPSGYYEGRAIEVRTGVRAAAVDPAKSEVRLGDGSVISYGALLIATGGSVRRLGCPGADEAGVLYFHTLDDARALRSAMRGSAIVIGGGFIALELLMSFVRHGVKTTAILAGDGFLSRVLDEEGKRMVRVAVETAGVEVRTGLEVRGIERTGEDRTAHFTGGSRLTCQAIGVGIGLEPNVGFLAGSGLAVGRGVQCDEHLRASARNVYAAGDVAEFTDNLIGERRIVGNWSNSVMHGKTTGANMAGDDAVFDAVTSYAIQCFDLPMAFLGAPEATADARIVRQFENGSLQFVMARGRVIGATCVGPMLERPAILRLIKERVLFDAKAAEALADPATPLASFLS